MASKRKVTLVSEDDGPSLHRSLGKSGPLGKSLGDVTNAHDGRTRDLERELAAERKKVASFIEHLSDGLF